MDLSREALKKLESSQNIWFSSVRPNGHPHMAPIWFAWYQEKLYVCIEAESVKGRNVVKNPFVVLALEDGSNPVICEGRAEPLTAPWPEAVTTIFMRKYDWDLNVEKRYTQLLMVTPEKWLYW
jgi:nitroimidazol reductase NimA-like FMN-containing flavoprotein (pyridoxamine 5'-phosphate oxidase superfamily)